MLDDEEKKVLDGLCEKMLQTYTGAMRLALKELIKKIEPMPQSDAVLYGHENDRP